jgi:hypothetical protein
MTDTFQCPKCKRVIGTFCDDLLIIDGLIVKELHAVCTCGHELHYTLSGRRFERLVEAWSEKMIELE